MLFAVVHESAIGTKRTWASALHMSGFGGKADMRWHGEKYTLRRHTMPRLQADTPDRHVPTGNIHSSVNACFPG
jgi:hypothetical protein